MAKRAVKTKTKAKRKVKRAPRATRPDPRTLKISDAIGEAFGELDCLADEMDDWRSNIEDKFSHTDKYQTVSDAADSLRNFGDPEMERDYPAVGALEVTIQDPTPRRRGYSRADRLDQCKTIIDAILAVIETACDDAKHPLHDEATGLRDELDNVMSEIDGIEFPGMYG